MAYTAVNKSSAHFNTLLYTGNGSTQSITGVGFKPDLLWIKCRGAAENHTLVDSVKGDSSSNSGYWYIQSNTNGQSQEHTGNTLVDAITSDGFNLGNNDQVNVAQPFVSWNWKADGTAGSANTEGTLTSTVAVNTTAGFSICKYTGVTGAQTFGHGLGVVPKMVMIKNLDSTGGSAEHWRVYHKSITASSYLRLNENAAKIDDTGPFSGTTPTDTLVYVGGDDGTTKNGEEHIAYCFAEVKGYSKFGTYEGTGNADGAFVYTGFRPAFVMMKCIDSAGTDWNIWDNRRPGYNPNYYLPPNKNLAEVTAHELDLLSNGFKARANNNDQNKAANTYIYAAFAEAPFVNSNGVPCNAR